MAGRCSGERVVYSGAGAAADATAAETTHALARGDPDQLALLGAEYLPTTPVRRQYLELKAQHPDAILFFRLGDFYETFDDDARLVARELDIALTGRELGRGERVPMAGVPYHAAEGYIARLIERGHRVALCDQVGEVPARGLVRREVVRVVTPGTLVEDGLLPARANNYLAALLLDRGAAGLATVDVSTGQLGVAEIVGPDSRALVAADLVRLGPSECLIPDGEQAALELLPPGARPTTRPTISFAPHRAAERLRSQFEIGTLGSLGLDERPLAARAAGALLDYVGETIPSALRLLNRIEVYAVEGSMVLDAATRRSLELTQSLRSGDRAGTLLEVIDRTRTAMGARLLRAWVSRPLLDGGLIGRRHDAVELLVNRPDVGDALGRRLDSLPDLERLAGRAAQRLLSPRDALALAAGLRAMPELRCALSAVESPLLRELRAGLADCGDLAGAIEGTVADPPAASFGEGVIREGASTELDETRALAGDTRGWIARLEQSERERTGVRSLRVGYNRVFGYYFELSKSALSQPTDYYQQERSGVPEVGEHLLRLGYVRRQTLTNGERFITSELQEYEARIRGAQETLARVERRVFDELIQNVASRATELLAAARAVAELDALLSLADVARRDAYVRPVITDDDCLEIDGGRHPVVERALGEGGYVPNETRLGGQHPRVAILTGPNMAGKSTYLRQVALIALLAQIGSYVPADRARLGLVDRIFARVGAQDDLAGHRSTFMVEMIETANILRSATPRSLLILDEIGRGTSTFDGIAVARAVVEHIHDDPRLGCKTLFATHYHELAELESSLQRAAAYRMEVLERGDQVVFLHRVAPGAADRSYGVHVARLAGVPSAVTRRAAQILTELERRNSQPVSDKHPAQHVESGVSVGARSVIDRLSCVEPLDLTPMQALATLGELVELVRGDF